MAIHGDFEDAHGSSRLAGSNHCVELGVRGVSVLRFSWGRPMSGIVRRRWKSKFARFIQSYGVKFLAVELDVTPFAIYHWIRGASVPRPAHAKAIQRLARERGSRLTMDEIYRHSRTVREEDIKLGPVLPPRPAAVAAVAYSLQR